MKYFILEFLVKCPYRISCAKESGVYQIFECIYVCLSKPTSSTNNVFWAYIICERKDVKSLFYPV